MKKKLLTACALLCVGFAFAGCQSATGGENNAPVYPPDINLDNSVEASSSVLTKDESGLFSYTMGIDKVTYGAAVPEIYANLEDYTTPKTGVRFDANLTGAQIYYNRVIDLRKIDGDLITFEVYSNEFSDVGGMAVELIDIYDSSKIVKTFWNEASASTVTNQHVTCNGITLGCANDSTQMFGLPRVQYGTISYTTSFQEWYRASNTHKPFQVRYNEETNEVIADVAAGKNANFTILDVDNPLHMGEENVFEGFTTGEVYLRVTFEKVSVGGAIVITTVGGYDVSGETIEKEPTNAIKVLLDDTSYAKEMPVGKVGAKYPVPKADNKDLIRGEYDIYTMVKAPDGRVVKQENGYFTPTETGTYQIIYSAKDINGFRVTKTLKVSVQTEIDEMAIATDTVADYVFKAGEWSKLPTATVFGGSGVAKVDATYLFNGKEIALNKIGKAVFDGVGTLQVKVVATDYLSAVKSEEFTYQVVDNPVICLTEAMPKGVESGTTLYFPDFAVKSFDGGVYETKSISVNGETLGANRKYTVSESGSLTVVYTATAEDGASLTKEFTVAVTEQRTADGENAVANGASLFIANDKMTTAQAENGILLQADENGGEAVYAYPLSADVTEINVRWTEQKNFEYIEFILADGANPEDEIAFRLYTSATLAINARVQDEKGSFDTYKHAIHNKLVETERLHVFYDNFKLAFFNVNLVKTAQVRYTTDGEVFDGFESGILTLKIRLGGVTGASAVVVAQLGNQAFDKNVLSEGDLRPAQLAPEKEIVDGVRAVGSTLIVPKAQAVDVLSLNATVLVSLRAPDGTYLLKEEECDEERVFTLTQCGNYTLNFILEDANWNIDRDKVYYITVVDETPPEMQVTGEYKKIYKLGDKITPLETVATDGVSAAENIRIYVLIFTPKYENFLLIPSDEKRNSFTFEEEGNYRIFHYAVDEAGNYSIVVFDVEAY